MSTEAAFISALRTIAVSSAARGLADDAAVLEIGGTRLVLTMDAIVEGVHFLPDDPPATVAWKLVATNVSDLAAKGAVPSGCLLSYALTGDDGWDAAFLSGLAEACSVFAIPLLGGDTVRHPSGSARGFSLVAFGEPQPGVTVPSRSGSQPGDMLWVSGTIGDAGLGLAVLRDQRGVDGDDRQTLIDAYRTPRPNLQLGVALAPQVSAMMDVSDGVLIDAQRLAEASHAAVVIDLERVPLSRAFAQAAGTAIEGRMFAATAGDDYCLLFSAPPERENAVLAAAAGCEAGLHVIGRIMGGRGLTVLYDGDPVPLPTNIGYEH